jgi:hypothetical protein
MAYRTGIALGYAVRDGAAGCDRTARNTGPTMIAVAGVATGVGVGGAGLEGAYAVTASRAWRGVEGMKASTTKSTGRMKSAATTKASSGMKATPTMETAASAVKTAAPAMKTTPASAMARLCYVCECQPHECAREDPSECQGNLLAAHSSQHVFLHLY